MEGKSITEIENNIFTFFFCFVLVCAHGARSKPDMLYIQFAMIFGKCFFSGKRFLLVLINENICKL